MMREQRSRRLSAEPYTQWEPGVESPGSACGPATMAALMEYWHTRKGAAFIPGARHFATKAGHINYIYRHYGGTPWGMSARSFAKGAGAYISAAASHNSASSRRHTVTVFNDLERYRAEIDAGRPVALKFDKWFSFRWRGRFVYDYHWVLGIGYEEPAGGAGPMLLVHDNGVRLRDGGYRSGQERRIPYLPNRNIITMVGLNLFRE